MMRSDHARIFDIRRFSTHDGEGIRTTVFFKGCPLRCAWCHNPEGISSVRRPIYFSGSCIGCGSCLERARFGGVVRGEAGLHIDANAAEDWDAIMDACPTGALRWDSCDISMDELMAQLRKDTPFYAHGGGGVTLSGGDPLFQADFAAALLERCRNEGIHTAIETELYAPWADAERVLLHAETIYADLKLMDGEAHRKYTGADNTPILQNLRRLLAGEMREWVIVRTPLIPSITATEENVAAVSRFIAGLYSEVRLELLNYNPLAAAKYPMLGRAYCFRENPRRFSEAEMRRFRSVAAENGVKNLVCD